MRTKSKLSRRNGFSSSIAVGTLPPEDEDDDDGDDDSSGGGCTFGCLGMIVSTLIFLVAIKYLWRLLWM